MHSDRCLNNVNESTNPARTAYLMDTSFWVGATNAVSGSEWRWLDGTVVEMGAPFWGRVSFGVG